MLYYTYSVEKLGYGRVFIVLSERFLSTYYKSNETTQPYMRLSYDKCLASSVSFSHFLCHCLCMLSPHALFLPGVMELHEVDATLALSLSLSTLNHIYSAQSKPLIRAVEIQTDLCETDCM